MPLNQDGEMTNISKIRDIADLLSDDGSYNAAYELYNEIYSQIWAAVGCAQEGLSRFTRDFLVHNVKSSYDLRNDFSLKTTDSLFVKWFDLDTDQCLNEFIFAASGRLRCISQNRDLALAFPMDDILSQYLCLHNLIIHAVDDKWLLNILKVFTPSIEDNRLKSLRKNFSIPFVEKSLDATAAEIKSTDWFSLNVDLLTYMKTAGLSSSSFFRRLSSIVGPYSSRQKKRTKGGGTRQNSYEKYERYEKYEKYEKYEHFEGTKSGGNYSWFDSGRATEEEKSRHYGKVLHLSGRLTKSQIRKKYIDLIGQYHPDRVHDLGAELVELAERKTKELNEAYEWIKVKYQI